MVEDMFKSGIIIGLLAALGATLAIGWLDFFSKMELPYSLLGLFAPVVFWVPLIVWGYIRNRLQKNKGGKS